MATDEEARATRDAKLEQLHERLTAAVDLLVSGEVKAGGLRELAGHLYRRPAQAAEDGGAAHQAEPLARAVLPAAWEAGEQPDAAVAEVNAAAPAAAAARPPR